MTQYTIFSASAGSGKTYTVTQELKRKLFAKTIDPSKIIATTFTRKAAGELVQRVSQSLIDNNLHQEALDLPASLIGTVNSVTDQILTRYAIDAGYSPTLAVIGDKDQKLAFDAACSQVFAQITSDERALINRMGYLKDTRTGDGEYGTPWVEVVRRIAEQARANLITTKEALEEAADNSVATFFTVLGEEDLGVSDNRQKLLALLVEAAESTPPETTKKDGSPKPIPKNRIALEKDLETWTAAPDSIDWYTWYKIDSYKLGGPKATEKKFRELRDNVGCGLQLHLAGNPYFRADAEALIRLMFAKAAEALQVYQNYKLVSGLIDYTDQEQLTLQLVKDPTHTAIREAIADCTDILVVDEFQDTSPIQLALFTEIGKLAKSVMWVGDQKQSIYGFRGADPSLMDEAITVLKEKNLGTFKTLDYSFRTFERPLALSNELFSRAFGQTEGVVLSIPEQLHEAHAGGRVELWDLDANNADVWYYRIALGVKDLIDRDGAKHKSRAVLTRTRKAAEKIRAELHKLGVNCEGGSRTIRSTREGLATVAGVIFATDQSDSEALIELVQILDDHESHDNWFAELSTLADPADRPKLHNHYRQDPVFTELNRVAARAAGLSPVELVTAVIDALDLPRRIAGWSNPGERTTTLDGIISAASDYENSCRTKGEPATHTGLIRLLSPRSDFDEQTVNLATNPDAVFVDTMHQSKGLEWDEVVVVPSKPTTPKPGGVWVESPDGIDLNDPLAGRALRFWPSITMTLGQEPIKDAINESAAQKARNAREDEETRRVSYVALSRSKSVTILAPQHSINSCDLVPGTGVGLTFLPETTELAVTVDGEKQATIPVEIHTYRGDPVADKDTTDDANSLAEDTFNEHIFSSTVLHPDNDPTPANETILTAARVTDLPLPAGGVTPVHLPARLSASSVRPTKEQESHIKVGEPVLYGTRLVTDTHATNWSFVGDAVHAYLASPYHLLDSLEKHALAKRLLDGHHATGKITAEAIVASGDAWLDYLRSRYTTSARTADGEPFDLQTEVPFSWRNQNKQLINGWIDEIVTLPDGSMILIDHKSHVGHDPVAHIRKSYIGQMAIYADAIFAATGQRPKEVLIHLPLLGATCSVAV